MPHRLESSSPAPRVICIAGSGHGGSTILQYLIAGALGALGVGEAENLFRAAERSDLTAKSCSCGRDVARCPLWGPLVAEPTGDPAVFLSSLIAGLHHGGTLVDSSKSLSAIRAWERLRATGTVSEVRTIYLVRDFRGWAASDRKVRHRKDRPRRSAVASMRDWYHQQRRFLDGLPDLESPSLTVSYEHLVFNTHDALNRMARFLDVPERRWDVDSALSGAVVHDVFGNRIKSDPSKRASLTYDDRWLSQTDVNVAALVLPRAWRLNTLLQRSARQD